MPVDVDFDISQLEYKDLNQTMQGQLSDLARAIFHSSINKNVLSVPPYVKISGSTWACGVLIIFHNADELKSSLKWADKVLTDLHCKEPKINTFSPVFFSDWNYYVVRYRFIEYERCLPFAVVTD